MILAEGLEGYLRSLVTDPGPVLAEIIAHGERDRIPKVYTETGRRYLERAGLRDRTDLRLQDGAEGLESLAGPFDFAFLDASKDDYARHLELVVPLLRPGGAVAIDNVLLSGMVASGRARGPWSEEDVLTMRAFNADLIADQGLTATVLSVGDGVAVAVRR